MLLHTCCAPCSTTTIERLSKDFDLTVLYYNPNIYPETEYTKRKAEQKRYIDILNKQGLNIKMLDCDYDASAYQDAVYGLENEPEGGKRCKVCFALRLGFAAKKAKELGFDIFATSLTVSPHKNHVVINQIGNELAKEYGVEYYESNFKKQDGYKRSIELSAKNKLYRQNYCGCKYSMWFLTQENDR